MTFSAQQIADFLSGEIIGNKDIIVGDLSKIDDGRAGTLTFLSNPKYTPYIYTTKADVVLVDKTFVPEQPVAATLIRVDNAYEALAKLLTLVDEAMPRKRGISAQASIDPTATLGEDCYVGAFAVIGANTVIGNRAQIYSHTVIGDDVTIGEDVCLYAHVTVYDRCRIGHRCIIHAGAVIGADGFGFAPSSDGHYRKIPQIGIVELCDDVEIGANTTVDRAAIGATVVNRGVKIDNLVQIAHNAEIGENTVIAAQSGVAGSTKIGRQCEIGGQVGFSGHITVAEGSRFGAQAGVPSSIKEPNKAWQGTPAMPYNLFYRANVIFKRLPELYNRVEALEKKQNASGNSNEQK
ncbi:MAG: UDP-3-O-(3-hydroxymyristoyl)glucosamine N-acyltransferase [Prevotellaceae bacterium]|jgi:UDP-3-O-[3-hydroxymyristoyl] glucosamine N-acyltransferase|nr:UDP-3-O-(3-hydroxymyristoyl)glucosamine N-acyltransferase [Prevotellaceae bacterium]